MERNMKQWIADTIASPVKKAMPVLSFPAIQKLGITVKELISDSDIQARGMKAIADCADTAASVSLMDVSLEAEAVGSQIKFSDDEVPAVIGSIVNTEEDADALQVPEIGAGRTGIYIDAIKKACELITDRPVFAGVIGPFSLAGRLVGVSEAMIYCYDEPDMMETVLNKCTEFLINYCKAYKETGCNGILMAEPLTGLLSPSLAEEFYEPYVKRIIDAVQDDNFIVAYHNCGNYSIQMIDSILRTGAPMVHFGDAIDMAEMMPHIPENIIAAGNVSPSKQFRNGTVETIREETLSVMEKCCKYPNFLISSGCDIPPMSKWENIDAFFAAVNEFYSK